MSYKEVFSRIYENYGFGSTESRSGPGSTLEETKLLREEIKKLIIEKEIKSVVDIPCGDFHWMKEIVFNFDSYIGGDIVEKAIETNNERYSNSRIKFIHFDLVNDSIPEGDLLIVRDVIGHFPIEGGKKIIENILKSKCKYLLSTTWASKRENIWSKCNHGDVHRENEGVDFGRFYPVNLMADPFNFPEADIFLEEDVRVDNWDNGNRKTLALWDLQKVRDHLLTVKGIETELDLLKSVISRLTNSIQTQEWSIVEEVIKDLFKYQKESEIEDVRFKTISEKFNVVRNITNILNGLVDEMGMDFRT
jgi:hypothetical protein